MTPGAGERATELLREAFPPRREDARKGDYGRVVVAGGSERYTGVLVLNALAALRAGADLAIVVAPRRAADVVANASPDLIAIPCEDDYPDPAVVARELAHADALLVGGGASRAEDSMRAFAKIVDDCAKPLVVDAGALHAIASHPDLLRGKRAILTPNPGEYEALTGSPWPAEPDARVQAATRLARARSCTVIVKGRWDVISDGERASIDDAGSPYLTKGGHGDVLAGACAALLARGLPPYEAACAAATLVGRAGVLAASVHHEGTLATDVLAFIDRVHPR